MSQKGYINQIVRKLQCSKEQKKEIKRQLESDIQAAVSGGETMQEIQQRMGTPMNVAKEFNDNFKPDEVKKAKNEKRIKIIAISLAVCVLFVGFIYWYIPKTSEFGSSGKFMAKELQEQAEIIIGLVNEDDFEGLQEQSNEMMKKMFVKEQQAVWLDAKALLGTDWGAFISVEDSFLVEVNQMGQDMAMISVKATYENVSIVYQLAFDEQMKLAGIYMR